MVNGQIQQFDTLLELCPELLTDARPATLIRGSSLWQVGEFFTYLSQTEPKLLGDHDE